MARIEPARSLDAGAVGHILSETTDALDWLPRMYSRAEELMYAAQMIEAGWVSVARVNNQIVGFLARQDAEIHGLYLRPDAQGQGLGRMLLKAAMSAELRLGLWVYQANVGAQGFYRSMRFAEVIRTEGAGNDAKQPDIRYEWRERVA